MTATLSAPDPQEFVEAQAIEKALEEQKERVAVARRRVELSVAHARKRDFCSAFYFWHEHAALEKAIERLGKGKPLAKAFLLWRGERDPGKAHTAALLLLVASRWKLPLLSSCYSTWVDFLLVRRAEKEVAEAAAAESRERWKWVRDTCTAALRLCISPCLCRCMSYHRPGGDETEVALMATSARRSDDAAPDESAEEPAERVASGRGGSVHNSHGQHNRQSFPEHENAVWWNLPPAAGSWRAALGTAVTSQASNAISTVLVLLNVVLMCMPYSGMSAAYAHRLEMASSTLTWLFVVEMGLKLVGLGCSAYWSDGWNVLDGSIVSLSAFEMVTIAVSSDSGVQLSYLRMLRMMRVLRMLRLMKAWRGLYIVVSTVVQALPQACDLATFFFQFSPTPPHTLAPVPGSSRSMPCCSSRSLATGLPSADAQCLYPPLLDHDDLCSARDAALWWTI